MRIIGLATVCVALSGCAPGYLAAQRGDYASACEAWIRSGSGDPKILNNIGYCYQNGYYVPTSRSTAVQYYTRAAALGDHTAIRNLTALGEPIPPVRQPNYGAGYDPAAMGAAINLLNAGRAPQPPAQLPPRPVQCETYRLGDRVYTDCR